MFIIIIIKYFVLLCIPCNLFVFNTLKNIVCRCKVTSAKQYTLLCPLYSMLCRCTVDQLRALYRILCLVFVQICTILCEYLSVLFCVSFFFYKSSPFCMWWYVHYFPCNGIFTVLCVMLCTLFCVWYYLHYFVCTLFCVKCYLHSFCM